MHEFSVTKSLVDLCRKEAKQSGISKISKIILKIGKFTGFSPESISFYFDYLKPNTECVGAKIVFEEIPIRIKCLDCKEENTIDEPIFLCPKCGGVNVDVLSGREFYVESIEGE